MSQFSDFLWRVNPVALRKAKIVYNFGLSECNMVKHLEIQMYECFVERASLPVNGCVSSSCTIVCKERNTKIQNTSSMHILANLTGCKTGSPLSKTISNIFRISSVIRRSFFSFQNNPKVLDPSCKTDLEL